MAKRGMKRIDRTHTQPKNQVDPVPELQGAAKHTKQRAPRPLPPERAADPTQYKKTACGRSFCGPKNQAQKPGNCPVFLSSHILSWY